MKIKKNFLFLLLTGIVLFSCSDHPSKPKTDVIIPPLGNDSGGRTIDGEPDWSQVADVIVFTHVPQNAAEALDGDSQIWTMDFESGEREFVTQGSRPRWSADGTHIAFHRNLTIWLRNMITGNEKPLTPFRSFFPSWSPDNSWIIFDAEYLSPNQTASIWKIHPDSTGLMNIAGYGTFASRFPDWSPAGDVIVFERYIQGAGSEICLMDTSGNLISQLTNNDYPDTHPQFSMDGKKITWVVDQHNNNPANGIWIMNADGTNKKWLAKGGMPTFSRDGKSIIYFSWIDSIKTETLLMIDIDGTNNKIVWLP
ncbi:MAG: PD40 domain-containing protein [Bacteroidetes bacterium]|nr:PD40 domain-containing protein [Bacteroidota bacterium]